MKIGNLIRGLQILSKYTGQEAEVLIPEYSVDLFVKTIKSQVDQLDIDELIRLGWGYNPEYTPPTPYDKSHGDDDECRCGHSYYRHFDTYDSMAPVGCKYCYCGHGYEDGSFTSKTKVNIEYDWFVTNIPRVYYDE